MKAKGPPLLITIVYLTITTYFGRIANAEACYETEHVLIKRYNQKKFINFSLTEYIITSENMPDSKELSVVLGQEVTFSLGVTTIQSIEVKFKWFKSLANGLVSNPHLRIWKTGRYNNLSDTRVKTGYLQIHGAKYSDKGYYTCKAAVNGKVIARKDVLLTVQGKLDVLCSFLFCDWLFPLSVHKVSSANRFSYKSTRERIVSKGLYGVSI